MSNLTESEGRDLHALRRAGEAEAIVRRCADILLFAGADTDSGVWECSCCYAIVGEVGSGVEEPDPDPMLHDAACVYRRAMEWQEAREGGNGEQ